MAESKYDLYLVPTKDKSRIRHQPWYKERLHTKYHRPINSKEWKPKLSSASWTFIKDGLDDFRDGKPPPVENENILIKGSTGLEPNLFGIDSDAKRQPKQKIAKILPKEEAVFQKQLPQQCQRRKRIDDIEKALLDHPLALFPHFEDSLPPDLFEDIVELLDPAMNLTDEDDQSSKNSDVSRKGGSKSYESVDVFSESSRSQSRELCSGYRNAMQSAKKNQYKWLHEPVEITKEERIKAMKMRQESPNQETGIDEVTKEFCDWVRNLGGQSNRNIEESTIYSLFASGYETKPALSVPIHVVELTNVPPELRSGNIGPVRQDTKQKKKTDEIENSTYTPSWVQKYHSPWYLDPKIWTTKLPAEGLQDPKENKEQQMTEAKKRSKNLDKVLATLHGARAFKEFIDTKKTRRPEFLESVAKHQEEIAAEALKMSEETNGRQVIVGQRQRTSSKRNTLSPKSRTESLN